MYISLKDSCANGFRKWADAHQPEIKNDPRASGGRMVCASPDQDSPVMTSVEQLHRPWLVPGAGTLWSQANSAAPRTISRCSSQKGDGNDHQASARTRRFPGLKGLPWHPGKRPDYDPSRSPEHDRGAKGPRGQGFDSPGDCRAARCALLSGANRAHPGFEPAQCGKSDHWFRNTANWDKVHVARRSKLSRLSNGTSRSWFRISGGNGFLRSAAMTAAGIVGEAPVFEGIQSMFGQHDAATITGNQAALPGLGKTFFSKRYGAETDASAAGSTSDHKYGISRVQSDGQVRW